MERRNGNYGAEFQAPKEFRHPAVTIEVGSETVPYLREGEVASVTLAPFKDHGRPAFISSTIKSNEAVIEAADTLSEKDSQRLNEAMDRTMELLLDDGFIGNGMSVMTSKDKNKPDVFIINIGSSYSDSSLRLYCHIDSFNNSPVLYQDGRGTKKTAKRIERELAKAGYSSPNNFGHNDSRGRRR